MFDLALSFVEIKEWCPPVSKLRHGLNRFSSVAMATTSHQEGTPKLEDVADQVSKIGQWKLKIVRGEWVGERVCACLWHYLLYNKFRCLIMLIVSD